MKQPIKNDVLALLRRSNQDGLRPVDLCARRNYPKVAIDHVIKFAILSNALQLLSLLLYAGVPPSEGCPSFAGYTPLHHAAVHNSVDCARVLIRAFSAYIDVV